MIGLSRAWTFATLAVLAAATFPGCGLNSSQTSCSMEAQPSNPAEVVNSWSSGFAVAIGTIGDRTGTTKVYSPGYKADVYRVDVETVLVDQGNVAPDQIDEIANVHYPKPEPGCGAELPVASLKPGQQVVLILAPPDPSKTAWTVDGDRSALSISADSGAQTATWQARVPRCDGHLTYDLAELTAAFTDPASRQALQGNCSIS